MNWLLFVILSALGAALRWGFSELGQKYFAFIQIPLGTLIANSIGAFLIGWLYAQYSQGKLNIPGPLFIIVLVAFLGSLTTFSSFALDTLKLLQNGQWQWASLNIFLNNSLALGLCYLGIKAS